jgi:lysophospholipase L1-like esterase
MKENNARQIILLIILVEVIIVLFLSKQLFNRSLITDMPKLTGNEEKQTDLPQIFPFSKESENPILHAELIPNHYQLFNGFTVKLNTTIIKINSEGFRDVEYTIEKPPNTVRIIALGDSFTFGWGLNLSNTYVKVLERKLNEMNATANFQVMNFGVPGYNTLEEIEFLKQKGLKYKPDIVLVGYTAGDLQNNTKIKTGEFPKKASEIVEELFSNSTEKQKEVLKSFFSFQLLEEDVSKNFDTNLEKIVLSPLNELATYQKEQKFKVIIVFLTRITAQEKERISELGKKNGFCIIDVFEEIKKYNFNSITFPSPDNHYNELGHNIIANNIFEKMIHNCNLQELLFR